MTSIISRYGSSCLKCRKRKVRCDGTKPACKNCVRSNDHCVYNAYDLTIRLQNALSRTEKRLKDLVNDLENAISLCPEECHAKVRTILNELEPPTSAYGSSDRTNLPNTPSKSISERNSPQADFCPWYSLTNSDNHGTTSEEAYLVTSRFHIDESNDSEKSRKQSRKLESEQVRYHRRWLQSNARFQQSYESMAYTALPICDGLDADTARILLQLYWTWQAPLHNCVYRRTFFRDLAIGGPYFSKFLLNVIYAHACRHTQANDPRFTEWSQGEVFLNRARQLLLDELKRDQPAISTIQGLLILGGRQCAIGKSSEGWLYTGMAIRMILDLGFHLVDGRVLEDAEPDDLEARKRLFLSAYVWDKSISLTLGRPPSLTHMPFPEHCLYDLSEDGDLWRPHLLGQLESVYLPTTGYVSTTFSHFCKLATYVNLAYQTVFGPRIYEAQPQAFGVLENKLRGFYADLPSHLRMSEISQYESCPPPHICCLNILYHTILILIYRPFFRKRQGWRNYSLSFIAHAIETCKLEAAAVNAFFQAYGRSFDFQKQTYLLSYCVYTAATIEVELVGDEDVAVSRGAVERLATTLRMLETEARQTPGIRRSVEIIRERLDKQKEETSNVLSVTSQDEYLGLHDRHQSLHPRHESATLATERGDDFHASQAISMQEEGAATTDSHPWFGGGDFMPYLDGFDGSNVGGGFMPNILGWNLE